MTYNDARLDCGVRSDNLVADGLVIEVNAVERLLPVHEAQVLSYLRLGGYRTGLLIHFPYAAADQWPPAVPQVGSLCDLCGPL